MSLSFFVFFAPAFISLEKRERDGSCRGIIEAFRSIAAGERVGLEVSRIDHRDVISTALLLSDYCNRGSNNSRIFPAENFLISPQLFGGGDESSGRSLLCFMGFASRLNYADDGRGEGEKSRRGGIANNSPAN